MIRGTITTGIGLAALICATLAAAPAKAATTTSGPVSYVTAKATIGQGDADIVSAQCPGETSISGGGGGFTTAPAPGGTDPVEISSLRPLDGGDTDSDPDDFWSVQGVVGMVGSRTLRVTAICLQPSDDPFALTYTTQTGSAGAGSFSSSSSVACFPGEVTSGGLDTDASNPEDVELEELGLSFDGMTPMTNIILASYSKEGPGLDYELNIICTAYNVKQVFKTDVVFGGKHKIKVACPKNRRAVGGGYGRFPTDTIASEPYDSKDNGKAPDDGWKMTVRYAGGTPEAMYAWASCLKS